MFWENTKRSLKRLTKVFYFALKFVFYPFVLILTFAVPPLKDRPQFVVGTYTMFFFGFLSNFVWSNTPIGISLFLLIQITGIGLAILFIIWGADFEDDPWFRAKG